MYWALDVLHYCWMWDINVLLSYTSRNSPMSTLTADTDADAVSRCHYRTTGDGHHALRESGPIVEREDFFRRKALEEPILDHCTAAAATLLARLKDQEDGAIELTRPLKVARRREEHGDVAIVSARMHAPFRARLVREPRQLQ